MGPKQLTPSFREKVWGATRLEPWFPNSSTKIGEVWFEGVQNLPLLVKFLFTSENLSVQVHPEGKTEMWHAVFAEAGAHGPGLHSAFPGDDLRVGRPYRGRHRVGSDVPDHADWPAEGAGGGDDGGARVLR